MVQLVESNNILMHKEGHTLLVYAKVLSFLTWVVMHAFLVANLAADLHLLGTAL